VKDVMVKQNSHNPPEIATRNISHYYKCWRTIPATQTWTFCHHLLTLLCCSKTVQVYSFKRWYVKECWETDSWW